MKTKNSQYNSILSAFTKLVKIEEINSDKDGKQVRWINPQQMGINPMRSLH